MSREQNDNDVVHGLLYPREWQAIYGFNGYIFSWLTIGFN